MLYVTPDAEWSNVSLEQRTRLQETLALARTWEATVDILVGQGSADEILRYARAHNITQIFMGHSARMPWLFPVLAEYGGGG